MSRLDQLSDGPRVWPQRRSGLRASLVAALAALLLAATPVAAPDKPSPQPAISTEAPQTLPALVAAMRDAKLTTIQRYELAQRLLSGFGQGGIDTAAALLAPGAEPLPQQAVVHALIVRSEAVPSELVTPLVALLGRVDPVLNADLAVAVGRVSDRAVLKTLVDTAVDREGLATRRRAAILALGYQRRKRAAEALVRVLESPDAEDRMAATQALACLTGIDGPGDSPQRWQDWWNQTRPLKEETWNAMISDRLALRMDELAAANQVLEDRLVQIMGGVYLEAPPEQRLTMLLRMLEDPLAALRTQALDLVGRRLLDEGPDKLEPELRSALVSRIDDPSAQIQRRAVLLLRDMAEMSAADLVALRLTQTDPSRPEEVTQAYVLMLARQPRASAIDAIVQLLPNERLYGEAAAALVRAADQGLLNPRQGRRAAQYLHDYLENRQPPPEPVMVELLGRVADQRDWHRIQQWLKDPVPQVAEAAARAWAESTQPLDGVLRETQDPAVQAILYAAAGRRGNQASSLGALLAARPKNPEAYKAWSEAVVKLSGRIQPQSVLEAVAAMPDPGDRELCEQMLSAALEPLLAGLAEPNGRPTTRPATLNAALLSSLLLTRVQLRLDLQQQRTALSDLQWLDAVAAELPQDTLRRRDDLMLRTLLAMDDLKSAGDVAAASVARAVPGGQREARLRQVADWFFDRAEQQAAANDLHKARQTIARLAQALPAPAPDPVARHLAELQASFGPEPAAETAPVAAAPAPQPAPK